jgi:hypothetical protein
MNNFSLDNASVAMDEFTKRLQAIDQDKLRSYLRASQVPCYESTLLNLAFPEMEISRAEPLTLYQHHFLLFHVLYRLQDEFYKEGQYLFVHFMRTILVTYPEDGQCRFFEELLGRFCKVMCRPGRSYCDFHAKLIGDTALEELSIKYFYLDAQNFYKLNAETAKAFIAGTWEILSHYDDYRKSFAILGIPETADLHMIKKRFKHLAKEYHPDRGAQSREKFHEINNAYQLLIRVHSMLKAFHVEEPKP